MVWHVVVEIGNVVVNDVEGRVSVSGRRVVVVNMPDDVDRVDEGKMD